MIGRLARLVIGGLAVMGLVAVLTVVWLMAGGIGARTEPAPFEASIARRLRSIATPAAARAWRNPEPATADTLRSGLEHYADHCAVCHANDGSGDTEMGRGLYPRAPDMRLEPTQSLSDGELFYIIENGIRFTGMPGWGNDTPEGQAASWHLVQFIRHLPRLTEAELAEMKALNPRSADEWRAEEEIRRFLEGEDKAPPPSPRHKHGGQ